jgi:hypothetical protein
MSVSVMFIGSMLNSSSPSLLRLSVGRLTSERK